MFVECPPSKIHPPHCRRLDKLDARLFTKKNHHSPLIEKIAWSQASQKIKPINPELVNVIESLGLGPAPACYVVRYPFGQRILEKGVLQIPSPSGRFLPIDHSEQDRQIQEDLAYIRGMPMGLVLSKSIEMFLSINGRETPFSIMGQGKIFGVWALLNRNAYCERGNMWNITSGARSVFMLPKLTDGASHKRLQRYCSLSAPAPQRLSDQWYIFTELINQYGPRENIYWAAELIFFPKHWIEKQAEPLWQALRLFLYESAWNATAHLRNQVIYDIEFYNTLENYNLKPDPYLVDTSRHTLAMATSNQTGFGIAVDDSAAPISFLQKVYLEIYDLPYAPTMMQPTYIQNPHQQPIYYSLHTPTLGGYSPKGRKLASKKYNLKELKYILQKTFKSFSENPFELDESPVSLHNISQNLSIRYFHTDEDAFGEIEHTKKIISSDLALQKHLQQYPSHGFCENSLFLCGVIQLSLLP